MSQNKKNIDVDYTALGEIPDNAEASKAQDAESMNERQTSRYERMWGCINKWWIFEIVAWLISAIAMVAIIVVLKRYEGKPLPEWPWHITLNSFISVMAAIAKTSLLVPVASSLGQLKWDWFRRPRSLADIQTFDAASRGPYGAVMLLFATKAVHLASFGALITLVALSMDPFVQQVVSYPSSRVGSDAKTASLPCGRNFTSYSSNLDGSEPSIEIRTAILNGLYSDFSSGSKFQVTPTCPTGNCTWQSYSSMAVCTTCTDISDHVTVKSGLWGEKKHPYHNYTINESGLNLELNLDPPVQNDRVGGMIASEIYNYETAVLNYTVATIGALQFINTTLGKNSDGEPGHVLKVTATECLLNACVQTYTANMTEGVFSERLLSSWSNKSTTLPSLDPPVWLVPDEADAAKPNNSKGGEPYFISSHTAAAIRRGLQLTFNSEVYVGYMGPDAEPQITSNMDDLSVLYQKGDLNKTIQNIGASLSRTFREPVSSGSKADQEEGTAFELVVHVHVRWWWLTLPIALEVCALGFLLATIAMSRRRGLEIYKSSPLALLRSGTSVGQFSEKKELHRIENAAGKTYVRLELSNGEIQLVEVK